MLNPIALFQSYGHLTLVIAPNTICGAIFLAIFWTMKCNCERSGGWL
ncbi:hypothetical protein APA_1454 [Pseudanabaena sp. lw0831]|nr:hypothetical protein APA_1454 [Pseudanabaena sp. lw0831]